MPANRAFDDAVSTPRFRSMRLDDIPCVCEIENEAFTTPWSAEAFRNELTQNHYAHYVVLEHEGRLAGYGGLWLIVDEAHITNVAVKAEFRGRGWGEKLMIRLKETALFLGAKRMTLEVRVSNLRAKRLYEKLGFYGVGIRKEYYTDNREDALIMWTHLSSDSDRGDSA
ncbi:ribosomal-protein-alanine acetyltransferase [Xylanibacillus composti]|uniref:Ribosomal-protein-alanine acetyltransferase n=2 Tax=Xylanibacillus composti TaxID=1572762 RepID=A0A8J4GYC2_9BACL|nr:ribosomal-protein-alanine acetyltransferase [Xylanibacillus composti]